jgi:hypothetical protein
MDWLNDSDSFELKPSITPKRIAQGLNPKTKKRKDNTTRRWSGVYTFHHGFSRSRHSKAIRKGNGKKEWGADRDAWGKPFVQGKSSRVRMRLIAAWWGEASE